MYHVLLHLHKRLPLGTFFRLIEDGGARLAPASKLLQVYAREQNREMLRDFYYSDDRRVESAVLALEEASRMTVLELVYCYHRLSENDSGSNCKDNVSESRTKILFRR